MKYCDSIDPFLESIYHTEVNDDLAGQILSFRIGHQDVFNRYTYRQRRAIGYVLNLLIYYYYFTNILVGFSKTTMTDSRHTPYVNIFLQSVSLSYESMKHQ